MENDYLSNPKNSPSFNRSAAQLLSELSQNVTKQSKSKKPYNPHISGSLILKFFITGLALIVFIISGLGWYSVNFLNGKFNLVNALNLDSKAIKSNPHQDGDENYLLVGLDTRAGNNGKIGAGTTEDSDGVRSDTIILVHIPAKRNRVVAISFPRDLDVYRPECAAWNNNTHELISTDIIPANEGTKLNSVYGYGGPPCLVNVIQNISGLRINHFAAIDFITFRKIVDIIGGVEVCTTRILKDSELGTILPKRGYQTLSGAQALNYVRARNILGDITGDYARIKRQQLFLSSLIRLMLSTKTLTDPKKLNNLISTLTKYIFVDGINTHTLIELAESLNNLDVGKITFLTLPTAGTKTDGSNNEIPWLAAINNLFHAIIYDYPLPGEKITKPGIQINNKISNKLIGNAIAIQNINVHVINGTGETGLATGASELLTQLGIRVDLLETSTKYEKKVIIRYPKEKLNAALTLAYIFPKALVQLDNTNADYISVILGEDYVKKINPAPKPGIHLESETYYPSTTYDKDENNSETMLKDLTITNASSGFCE